MHHALSTTTTLTSLATRDRVATRQPDRGMGLGVARRTVFRPDDFEDMGRVADRVALGNVLLAEKLAGRPVCADEHRRLRDAIARGALITSGRHLQHGDAQQYTRNMELHTNCATAALSAPKFYLLLNGSGVGRSYDDELMVVDWAGAPDLVIVLDEHHADWPKTREALFRFACDFSLLSWRQNADGSYAPPALCDFDEEAEAKARAFLDAQFVSDASRVVGEIATTFRVPDSREGWGRAIELYEARAYAGSSHETIVLDFSDVRPNGAPIAGMQDRPASGPLSVMRAFMNIRNNVVPRARAGALALWEQAMMIDHYLSVEVQVGGARRAARMSTKSWRDPEIQKFIRIKSEGGLWTSNNSVMVDAEFWTSVFAGWGALFEGADRDTLEPTVRHALEVFEAATACSWINGEPGFINGDRLESTRTGKAREKKITDDSFGSKKYQATWLGDALAAVAEKARHARYPMTTNPCGEIELHVTGGYCVIADWAGLHACPYDPLSRPAGMMSLEEAQAWDAAVEEAIRLGVRFTMRVNLMDSLYHEEVARTNRIGVGPTGLHEYAFARFGFTWADLVDEARSRPFWNLMARFSAAAKEEADLYADALGLERPHTVTTVKPAGTTSKIYGLSEGAHLPARRQYLRWVQFRGQKDENGAWRVDADPLLADYEAKGYPVRQLKTFPGMSIIGFPTIPVIARMGLGNDLVTAPEASPADQYAYLRLLEKHWIGESRGNQVSYTLKVYTDRHDLDDYRRIVLANQSTVRCCSVMPSKPDHEMGYEYLPEEEVSMERFLAIVEGITDADVRQEIDLDTLQCASGACPI